jgi:hypothetical protein
MVDALLKAPARASWRTPQEGKGIQWRQPGRVKDQGDHMAKLYGTLQGNKGETSRCGNKEIEAVVKNFGFAVSTHIRDNGGGDKDILDIEILNLSTGEHITVFHGSFAEAREPLRILRNAAVNGGGA